MQSRQLVVFASLQIHRSVGSGSVCFFVLLGTAFSTREKNTDARDSADSEKFDAGTPGAIKHVRPLFVSLSLSRSIFAIFFCLVKVCKNGSFWKLTKFRTFAICTIAPNCIQYFSKIQKEQNTEATRTRARQVLCLRIIRAYIPKRSLLVKKSCIED